MTCDFCSQGLLISSHCRHGGKGQKHSEGGYCDWWQSCPQTKHFEFCCVPESPCPGLPFAVAEASLCAQQDYSWEDHGFSLVNRLYSDIGHLLDEKFRMVDGLQSTAMAKRQGCEPSVFKRGIWNYIHCMFGIR